MESLKPSTAGVDSRFAAKSTSQDDSTTLPPVGLEYPGEGKKRRMEVDDAAALIVPERSIGAQSTNALDREATPESDHGRKKRRLKGAAKVKLSFAQADEEDEAIFEVSNQPLIPLARPSVLQPPSSTNLVPKVVTKAALQKESQMREQLRQEFLATQQAVRATEIAIPYVFYDGSNTPGGICRMKKGEQIWLFLDKARKVGAEKAVGVAGQGRRSRGEWARIGVDDLMLVKGDLIIPHHYEIYYFIVNRTKNSAGRPLFDYSNEPPRSTIDSATETQPLVTKRVDDGVVKKQSDDVEAQPLEGAAQDPATTKVVDRRWYEKNKHIYPASTWQDFDPEKDYAAVGRKRDVNGNSFFFG